LILKSPICVALDQRDPDDVARVATAVEPHVGLFKIGLTTFVAFGSYLTRSLAEQRPVFLDLKLHDIPPQVAGAVASVAETGASLVTIHAAGGKAMVQAAAEAAGEGVDVLAVTVLTSLDDGSLGEIGLTGPVHDAVLRLSDLALEAGVTGLVCSPLEVAALRERYGAHDAGGPLLVVPGIRPAGAETADQLRTMTPSEAMEAGADVLVVGRPITAADDPQRAAAAIEEAALRRET
jgi:orotidine-5'-phosphate decarboxylase